MQVETVESAPWRRSAAAFVLVIVGVAGLFAVIAGSAPAATSPAGSLEGPQSNAGPQGLASFQSTFQLQQYIAANAQSATQYDNWGISFGGPIAFGGPVVNGLALGGVEFAAAIAPTSATYSVGQSPSFTGTNVQVQGVDEPDIVKTDGTHLFVATNKTVSIINAYPPNSTSILSTIRFPKASVIGIEIASGRLMVIDQRTNYTSYVDLLLYNTTNLASPELMQNVTFTGTYVAARMAQGYVYAVIQQPAYNFTNDNAMGVLPVQWVNGVKSVLSASVVYYTPNAAQVSFYTMIPSVSMLTGQESVISVLTGPSSTVYVSTSNIYVVYSNYPDLYDVDGIPGNAFTAGVFTASDVQQVENSTILRASYSNGTVVASAAGVVPGTVLNQFSLDEYNGYFRVATSRFATIDNVSTMSDDVYVLDQNMTQVSALRNIAPGENIYAVSFVGPLGYVVTYEQVDPLFVISFENMSNPIILSSLKVTGYSDYLYPLPGGYLIGVGKDTVPASDGDYTFYTGLQVSLFQVQPDGTSALVAQMIIGVRGTDSPVLTDHLAFTFDPTRNITVIPLTLYTLPANETCVSCGYPQYGNPTWQGAYVIKVTDSGFTLLGKVSQYPGGGNFSDYPNDNLTISRSVIIGDFLYTISPSEVMVSNMTSFATVATIQLPI